MSCSRSHHLLKEGKWNRVKRSQERPTRPASSRRAEARADNAAELRARLSADTPDVWCEAADVAPLAQVGKSFLEEQQK